METPQREPITITQSIHDHSNTPKTVNKTVQTTLSQKQQQYRKSRNAFQRNVSQQLKGLTISIEFFNQGIEAIDKEFITFNDRCLKIESLCKSHAEQINQLQSDFQSYGDSIDEDLLELKKELENELKEKLKNDQATEHELLLLHMGSCASTEEKVNIQEESLKSLEKTTGEYNTLLGNVIEGINKSESLNKQAISLITQEISELKNNQSHLQNITVQQTQYANIEEKVNTLEESLKSLKKTTREYNTLLGNVIEGINKSESLNKQATISITQEISELKNSLSHLQDITIQQTQSISILRKWLMFMGGGSALALTIWLWHYTHK
jgi:predicted  nucleic acid-binding Zn-ribbon protein